MVRNRRWISAALPMLLLLSGCAAFRSDLREAYTGEARRNPDSRPVNVCFIFTHVEQTLGYDAVPKIVSKNSTVSGFDEIFAEALRELTNTGRYATFTEEASDVNQPARRAEKDSLKRESDYTVKVRIVSQKRFSGYFMAALVSTVSATLVPMPYKRQFRMESEVLARDGRQVGSYTRSATLSKWVQALLIVVYPFHPENRKVEEIYVSMLTDTFRQIESDGILKAPPPVPEAYR